MYYIYITLTNTTLTHNWSNTADGLFTWGSQCYYYYTALFEFTLNNCIVWGNYPLYDNFFDPVIHNLNYSCCDEIWETGTNNIYTDPGFALTQNSAHPYSLVGTSPCVDAGSNDYCSETNDIRGEGFPRNLDKSTGTAGIIDMGAYEYHAGYDPLPVELTSFTASIEQNQVTLKWKTATEVNNYGFSIERKMENVKWKMETAENNWETIGFVEGHGNSNSPKEYSFIDEKIKDNGKYSYRLRQIDTDGHFKYSDEVEVNVKLIPTEFALEQNYPNPFNPVTVIRWQLPVSGKVMLKIYDILGKEVAILVNENEEAGEYRIEFNGSNIPSGIYFYRIQAANFVNTKKLILLK